MAFAARRSPRVKPPKHRKLSPRRRRNRLRALSRGLAALVLGFVIVTTLMIGAGWALAVSLQARSDTRSVVAIGLPSDERAWTGPLSGGTTSQWNVVAVAPPLDLPGVTEVAMTPVRVAALAVSEAFETLGAAASKADITGSVGTPPSTSFTLASTDSTVTPAKLTDAKPQPLPKSAPKLAALTPMDGVNKPAADELPARTAVYDISAKLVYLPNGERLEAHSGYGRYMDDPRFVHVKNRGATPPNTYTLRMREALFHGVAAIRMLPVNEKDMFNRDGILAHSYLLGSTGQSHGCVSFKDYPRFLRAFRQGLIDRIVVVPRLDRPPTFAIRPKTPSAAHTS